MSADECDEIGWFRYLLNFSADEVYEMPIVEYHAYSRWMQEWLPHILYGAHAASDKSKSEPQSLASLPGGEIVKAY